MECLKSQVISLTYKNILMQTSWEKNSIMTVHWIVVMKARNICDIWTPSAMPITKIPFFWLWDRNKGLPSYHHINKMYLVFFNLVKLNHSHKCKKKKKKAVLSEFSWRCSHFCCLPSWHKEPDHHLPARHMHLVICLQRFLKFLPLTANSVLTIYLKEWS